MKKPFAKLWSFEYRHKGALYSLEIEAESQSEARERLRAACDAKYIGAVTPDDSACLKVEV